MARTLEQSKQAANDALWKEVEKLASEVLTESELGEFKKNLFESVEAELTKSLATGVTGVTGVIRSLIFSSDPIKTDSIIAAVANLEKVENFNSLFVKAGIKKTKLPQIIQAANQTLKTDHDVRETINKRIKKFNTLVGNSDRSEFNSFIKMCEQTTEEALEKVVDTYSRIEILKNNLKLLEDSYVNYQDNPSNPPGKELISKLSIEVTFLRAEIASIEQNLADLKLDSDDGRELKKELEEKKKTLNKTEDELKILKEVFSDLARGSEDKIKNLMEDYFKKINKEKVILSAHRARFAHNIGRLNTYKMLYEQYQNGQAPKVGWKELNSFNAELNRRLLSEYPTELAKASALDTAGDASEFIEVLKKPDLSSTLDKVVNIASANNTSMVSLVSQLYAVHKGGNNLNSQVESILNKSAFGTGRGANVLKVLGEIGVGSFFKGTAPVLSIASNSLMLGRDAFTLTKAINIRVRLGEKHENMAKLMESSAFMDLCGRIKVFDGDLTRVNLSLSKEAGPSEVVNFSIYENVVGNNFKILGRESFDGEFSESLKNFIKSYHDNKSVSFIDPALSKFSLFELNAILGRLKDGNKEFEKEIIENQISTKLEQLDSQLEKIIPDQEARERYKVALVANGQAIQALSRLDKARVVGNKEVMKQSAKMFFAAQSLSVNVLVTAGTLGAASLPITLATTAASFAAHNLISDNREKLTQIADGISSKAEIGKIPDVTELQSFFSGIKELLPKDLEGINYNKELRKAMKAAEKKFGKKWCYEVGYEKYFAILLKEAIRKPFFEKYSNAIDDLKLKLEQSRRKGETFEDELLIRELKHYLVMLSSVELELLPNPNFDSTKPEGAFNNSNLSYHKTVMAKMEQKLKILCDNLDYKKENTQAISIMLQSCTEVRDLADHGQLCDDKIPAEIQEKEITVAAYTSKRPFSKRGMHFAYNDPGMLDLGSDWEREHAHASDTSETLKNLPEGDDGSSAKGTRVSRRRGPLK